MQAVFLQAVAAIMHFQSLSLETVWITHCAEILSENQ